MWSATHSASSSANDGNGADPDGEMTGKVVVTVVVKSSPVVRAHDCHVRRVITPECAGRYNARLWLLTNIPPYHVVKKKSKYNCVRMLIALTSRSKKTHRVLGEIWTSRYRVVILVRVYHTTVYYSR